MRDPLALLRQLDAQAYHLYFRQLEAETVTKLKKQGFIVNAWTVNNAEDMQDLMTMEVNGIITDYVQRWEAVR